MVIRSSREGLPIAAMGEQGLGRRSGWIFFAVGAKPSSLRRAIAERLAEDEPIIIVDRPISVLKTRTLPSLQARATCLVNHSRAVRYRPLHFPEKLPGLGTMCRKLNQMLLLRELNRLLPPEMGRVVCYDSPTQYQLVGQFHEQVAVYLAVDDLTVTVTGTAIKGELEAEQKMLSRIDLVVCVSDVLAEALRHRAPSSERPPIHVLPNGYDERIFDPDQAYPEPQVLSPISRPRILVAGYISERIDWDGIVATTHMRPEWTWVFIGWPDEQAVERIRNDFNGKGYWYPPIPIQEIPSWIVHSDACAIPYRLNSFTRASNPLKALEYLAMGAPVLSTRIPSLQRYDGLINWVEEGDPSSYAGVLDRIRKTTKDQTATSRRRAVHGDSFANKVLLFKHMVLKSRVERKPC